jgi:hypothetical protein
LLDWLLRHLPKLRGGGFKMSPSFKIRSELAEMILRDEKVPLRLKVEMVREIFQLGDENAR